MKSFWSWLKNIVSHYLLGFTITAAYVLLSIQYYNATHLEEGQQVENFLIKAMQIAHQKTIDLRLQHWVRAPGGSGRFGSD